MYSCVTILFFTFKVRVLRQIFKTQPSSAVKPALFMRFERTRDELRSAPDLGLERSLPVRDISEGYSFDGIGVEGAGAFTSLGEGERPAVAAADEGFPSRSSETSLLLSGSPSIGVGDAALFLWESEDASDFGGGVVTVPAIEAAAAASAAR